MRRNVFQRKEEKRDVEVVFYTATDRGRLDQEATKEKRKDLSD